MPPKSMPLSLWQQVHATKLALKKLNKKAGLQDNYEEAPKPKKARTTKKAASKDVGTCPMTKKEIGDRVKSALALEKYSIPRMRIELDMDTAFFRSFFVSNANLSKPISVQPANFDAETPVVVVELGHGAAGEILGVSKVKGGNRMETTYLASMCAVLYPKEQKCRLWLSV